MNSAPERGLPVGDRSSTVFVDGKHFPGSESTTVLTGAEHAEHPYVTRGFVAAGIRVQPVKRPIAALAREFTHAGLLARCVQTRVIAHGPDRSANCRQFAAGRGT